MERTLPPTVIGLVWTGYLVVALLLLDVVPGPAYPLAVGGLGLVLVITTLPFTGTRWLSWAPRWADIAALGALYLVIVGLFRLAFGGFTTDNTLGLFPPFPECLCPLGAHNRHRAASFERNCGVVPAQCTQAA